MSALRTLIQTVLEECDPDSKSSEVADRIFERLSYQEYYELTYPLLLTRVARERRQLEERPTKPRLATARKLKPATPVADRAAWMNEQLLIPGRLSTTWGDATVADHLARIDYLKDLCAANENQIRKHQKAIEMIRRAHVKCLADVKVRAA